MEDNGAPELALRLIEENKKTKDPYLDLGNCGLTHLPEELGDCVWLEELTLNRRWIVDNIDDSPASVQTSKNEGGPNLISSLNGIEKLTKLLKLVVSDSIISFDLLPLSDLSPLSTLKSLKVINCRNTRVSDLSPLSPLVSLQKLFCYSTEVSDLEPLSAILSLRELNCLGTKVKKLKPLENLTYLNKFSFQDCLIEDCPTDVYESGDGATLRAFFQREGEEEKAKTKAGAKKSTYRTTEESQRHHDIKLILLGNSDSGKTSLLHYLKTGKFLTKRNSTHGLEVHRWLPDKKRFPSLSNVAVSIWDFGGQEYYHDAYRLFMSANAAYMLLWDKETNCNGRRPTYLKNGEKEEDLEHFEVSYWLDTVCYYCGDSNRSPLIVVQNKTDQSGKHRLSQDLHNQYVINESFHISLKCGCDDSETSHLRENSILRHFDAELEHALLSMVDKSRLPDAWLKVRSSLIDLQENKNTQQNPFAKKLKQDGSIILTDFAACCEMLLNEELKVNEAKALSER